MADLKVGIDSRGAKRGSNDAVKSLDRIRKAARRLNRDGLRTVGDGFSKLRRSVFNLKSAFAGVGIGLLTRSFVQAASTTENYRVRLEALTGSMEEANKVFQDMSKFAGEVPFAYEEIMDSATSLMGVLEGGRDELGQFMPVIADLAAVSGLSIQDTTSQVIRMYSAGAAAADMFRERGILAMLGFQAGVSVSAEETRRRLIEAWEDPESKFRGVTENLAKTWDGILSMLGDRWFMFRNMVMENDAFTLLKERASDFLAAIDEAMASGRMDAWAKNLAGVFTAGLDIVVALGKSVGWLFNLIAGNINNARILFASFAANIMKGWEMIKLGGSGVWLLIQKGFDVAIRAMQDVWFNFVRDIAATLESIPLGASRDLAASMMEYVRSSKAARGEAMNLQGEFDRLNQKHVSTIAGIDSMTQSVVDHVVELEKLRAKQQEVAEAPAPAAAASPTDPFGAASMKPEELAALRAEAWDAEQALMLEQGEFIIAEQIRREEQEKASLERSVAAKAAAYDQMQAMEIQRAEAAIAVQQREQVVKQQIARLNEQMMINGLKIGLSLFAKGKTLAIGRAIIATYQGAAQALRDVPYPYNIAAAGVVIASGLAQVRQIKSASAGGAGGGQTITAPAPSALSTGADGAATSGLTAPGRGQDVPRQEITFVINALDPESVDPGRIQEMIRRALPEVVKAGSGVVGDIEFNYVER